MYDAVAEHYNELFSADADLREECAVMDMIKYRGGALLDIGCGTGMLLKHFKPELYLGIDPSEKMLSRLHMAHGPVSTELATLETSRCWAHGWDRVVALFGAASYVDPDELRRIPRMLEKGGESFLMFYAPEYEPITHKAFNIDPVTYRIGGYFLSRSERFGNYLVVRQYPEDRDGIPRHITG